MKLKPEFDILMAGVLWGVVAIFIKGLTQLGFSSLQCVVVRMLFSALLMSVYLGLRKPSALHIRFRDIPFFWGAGICSLDFFTLCYFDTIQRGGVGLAAFLLYTAPAFVLVFARIFFGEKLTGKKIAALFLAIAGTCFLSGIFSKDISLSFRVLLTGLGAGLGYALYSVFAKFVIDRYSSLTITTYTFIFGAIGLLPLVNIADTIEKLNSVSAFTYSWGLAIISGTIPYILYTHALHKCEAGKASMLATIEPLVATALGIFMFGEALRINEAIGMAFIFSAVFLLSGGPGRVMTKWHFKKNGG